MSRSECSGSMRITNRGDHAIDVLLEPWYEECTLLPGATAHIVYSGPNGGEIEVEHHPDRVIVYGFVGSVMELTTPDK